MSRHPELRATVEKLVVAADVVHVHALWEQIQHEACRAASSRGVPYVVTPHGMLDPWNMSNTFLGGVKKRLYLRWRMRGHLERAAAIHFATEMERDVVARLGLETPTIVEPFGLDGREFAELPALGEFRKRFAEFGDRKLVLFLGRLDYGKGLELLIPAFAEIARQRDDVRLVIAGPDSHSGYRTAVERLLYAHKVWGKTVLTGMLRGRERLAALVDAYVLCQPSYHENFGLVVVEALACGTPVVVSDQVYLHPWVTEAGVGGVCTLSVEDVARELGRWLADDSLRSRAAEKGRPFALGNFDWDAIGRRWVEHYRVIAGSRIRDGAPVA
jgi:glycosyltransferase involved in cell wall biosynthesis